MWYIQPLSTMFTKLQSIITRNGFYKIFIRKQSLYHRFGYFFAFLLLNLLIIKKIFFFLQSSKLLFCVLPPQLIYFKISKFFISKSFLANICVFLSVLRGIYPSFQLSANGTFWHTQLPSNKFLGFIAFKIYFYFGIIFQRNQKCKNR